MIADYLEEILVEAGYDVCGIAGNVAEAIALGERHRPDLGVIDMRLGDGEYGTEVAAALCPHGGFGVLYATGIRGTRCCRAPRARPASASPIPPRPWSPPSASSPSGWRMRRRAPFSRRASACSVPEALGADIGR